MADMESGHRPPTRALVMVASMAVSLLIHGSVLAAAFLWIAPTPGAVTRPTEAISLELLESEVLEAVAAAPSIEAAASPASVQSDPGSVMDSAAARVPDASELRPVDAAEQIEAQDAAEAVAAHGMETLRGALESNTPAGVEQSRDKPVVEERPETPARAAKERKAPTKTAKLADPADAREADSEQRKKGGASSRAAKGSTGSAGRVSASRGSALNYGALVRARVASRKPAGAGQRGTVVISFGVSKSGGLAFASVARSSGNPSLDGRVLSAVRGAGPFPPPPAGARSRFAISFQFR
jgi:protein TonB